MRTCGERPAVVSVTRCATFRSLAVAVLALLLRPSRPRRLPGRERRDRLHPRLRGARRRSGRRHPEARNARSRDGAWREREPAYSPDGAADRVREPRERGVQHERRRLRPQHGRQRDPGQPHGRQHGRRPRPVLVARRDEGRLLEHPELGDRSLRHGGRRHRDGPAAHDGRRRRDGSGVVAGRRDDRLRDRSRRQRGPLGDRRGRHGLSATSPTRRQASRASTRRGLRTARRSRSAARTGRRTSGRWTPTAPAPCRSPRAPQQPAPGVVARRRARSPSPAAASCGRCVPTATPRRPLLASNVRQRRRRRLAARPEGRRARAHADGDRDRDRRRRRPIREGRDRRPGQRHRRRDRRPLGGRRAAGGDVREVQRALRRRRGDRGVLLAEGQGERRHGPRPRERPRHRALRGHRDRDRPGAAEDHQSSGPCACSPGRSRSTRAGSTGISRAAGSSCRSAATRPSG